MHSQTLLAFVQAGLPAALQTGAQSSEQLAQQTAIPAARLDALLRAATALNLCALVGEQRYALGDLGAVLIDNPGVVAMILHHAALYQDLADPLPMLREENYSGRLRAYWAYADPAQPASPASADVADYTQLMSASQESVAEQVLAAIDLGDVRHLLDVGGGNASFAIAAATRWPELQVTVADLPAVAELAQQRVASLGLGDRITTVGVDFTRTSLPTGHDAVSLVRILHDHDDPVVNQLLRAARASLPDTGCLFVAEPLAENSSAGRLLEVYFSLYLLAMGQGRLRRYSELKSMLEEAGFTGVRRLRTRMPLITSVLSGQCSART